MAEYIKDKLRILKQFGVRLTSEQNKYLHNLRTEISVDNYTRKLILDKLED